MIGAGVDSTAYNIANNGAKQVALIEEVDTSIKPLITCDNMLLVSTSGSSHGGSRIIRRGYHARHYMEMMREAFKLWERN